jgi:hypothetical protein
VNKAVNLHVTLKKGTSCLAERVLTFQEEPQSMEIVPVYGAFNG